MKSQIELGQLFWTNIPTIYDSAVLDLDRVEPWQGRVHKIIGSSIWLRQLDFHDDLNDVEGLHTAIVSAKNLHLERGHVP